LGDDKDDGDCRGGGLGGKRGGRAHGGDRDHPVTNQLVRQRRQTRALLVGPAVFDRPALALAEPRLLQAPPDGPHTLPVAVGRRGMQERDCRRSRLLRARRERPRSRAADERDELAALHPRNHSITSSARASTVAGISRPSPFAVLRLTTSSYLVGT